MAHVVIIRANDGTLLDIQKRDATLAGTGGVLYRSAIEPIKTLRSPTLAGGGTDIRLSKILDDPAKLRERRRAAADLLASDRFSAEQKEELYALLSGRTFALDYYSLETRPDVIAEPVRDVPGPPTYPPITRVVDP